MAAARGKRASTTAGALESVAGLAAKKGARSSCLEIGGKRGSVLEAAASAAASTKMFKRSSVAVCGGSERRGSVQGSPGKRSSIAVMVGGGLVVPEVKEDMSAEARSAEWISRLQANQDLREQQRGVCKQILIQLSYFCPEVCDLDTYDYVRALDAMLREVQKGNQHLATQAFEMMTTEVEELEGLRVIASEYEYKVAMMNQTYMKEISLHRDQTRHQSGVAEHLIEQVDKQKAVEFYEPLQYLSEEVRKACVSIIDEKLKALFTVDPTLKDNVNAAEMARFEDSLLKDKVASFEKANASLREEVRKLGSRALKAEQQAEKLQWELSANSARCKKMDKELESKEAAIAEARAELEAAERARLAAESLAEGTEEDTATEQCDSKVQAQSPASDAIKKRSSGCRNFEPLFLASDRIVTIDVETQVDVQELAELAAAAKQDESTNPLRARSKNQEIFLQNSDWNLGETEFSELTKFKKENSALRQQVKSLEESLANQVLKSMKDVSALQEQLTETTKQFEEVKEEKEVLTAAAEKAKETEAELEEVKERLQIAEQPCEECPRLQQEYDMLKRRTQALQDEASDLKAELDSEQRRRLALVREKAAGFSTQGMAAELEAEIRAREEVQDELDKMQSALSLILQKNSDLQVALAGCTCNGKSPSKSRVLVSDHKTRADIAAGHEQVNVLMGQKDKAMEKVVIQKAQLAEVMFQNQVLGMALEEMQMEMKKLSLELRKQAKKTENSENNDLEAVLGKMERVARRGGGAYLRLNTDAKLREVAKDVKKQNEDQAADDYHEQAQSHTAPSPIPKAAVSVTPKTPVVLPSKSLSLPPAGSKADGLVGLKSPAAGLPPVQAPVQPRNVKPGRASTNVVRQDSMRVRVATTPADLPAQGPPPNSARNLRKAKTLTTQNLTPREGSMGSMAIGSSGGFALIGGSAGMGGGR